VNTSAHHVNTAGHHSSTRSLLSAHALVQLVHMAKETTLGEIGEMLAHVVEHMATKEDVRAIVREELEPVEARLTSIESELRSIRRDLDELREKVENVSGFQKEIDHALERIGAIEKHLGIDKKIAA
jgi:septation ring formation regulator EzrA